MADKIKVAYKDSQSFYDSILTQSSFLGKLYMKLFWSGTDDSLIADKLLSHIPNNFEGTLLEVPVGTAVFTYKKWATLDKARITCLDYSQEMLEIAKERLGGHNNISCVQGDVGNLEIEDNSCDIVISMNGFHVFPDKIKAYDEVYRVLKPNALFIACFYVVGKSKITDWLVRNILIKKGWFTPPFQTYEDVHTLLSSKYKDIEIDIDGSMIFFKCKK